MIKDKYLDKLQENMIIEHKEQYREWKYGSMIYTAELNMIKLCFKEFKNLIHTIEEATNDK